MEANAQAVVESIEDWRRQSNKLFGVKGKLEYLVKWAGLGAEYDEWVLKKDMDRPALMKAYKETQRSLGVPVGAKRRPKK